MSSNLHLWPGEPFSPVFTVSFWFLILLVHLERVTSIMTFPNEGVYSLFPDEDLRTGKRNFRFEDELIAQRAGRERQLQALTRAPGDLRRGRGEATFVNNPNSLSNERYVIRPLDKSRGVVSFDDDRVRRPVNYISAYRDRNLPFDKPNPLYLPPRNPPPPSSLLRPVIPAFPESKLPPRRAMTSNPGDPVPTFHIYDPASMTFVPRDPQNRPASTSKLPPGIPDPRVKLKPGRLLLPGLHNALSSEETDGPDKFLNHEEYLDYHTKLALDDLDELDRKMHKFKHNGAKGNPSVNPKDAKLVLFDPNTSQPSTSTEATEDFSVSTEIASESLEGTGSAHEGRRPEVQGVKLKAYPIVGTQSSSSSSSAFGQKDHETSNKEVKANKNGLATVLPELENGFTPILTLPPHLKGEANPSQSRSQLPGAAAANTATATKSEGTKPKGGEPKVKDVKSELGTETSTKTKDQDDDGFPSSSLSPPPTTASISTQQKYNSASPIEIIPSIVTQQSSSSFDNTNTNPNGLIDGHFDFPPGVTETISFGPNSFTNNNAGDDFDDVPRFRTVETQTPFLYQESTETINKPMLPKSVHKKMILVKRIKNLDTTSNVYTNASTSTFSFSKSLNLSSSNQTGHQRDYEAKMTVHKIQDSAEKLIPGHGGIFSEERAQDFNLQSRSTSEKGVVSKIHAHVSSCPKLDGPSEVICDVHIRKRHGNLNPHLTVGWKRKFYNVTQPDIVIAVNKTLAYEEDFHDKFNVTLAPGINPMLRSVLRIRKVTPADTGTYQCEVSDGENSLKSETLLFLCH